MAYRWEMPNTIQFSGNGPIILKDFGLTLHDLGFEVRINVSGEIGKPILWDTHDGLGRMILFLHPIDFYWTEYGDENPELAHTLVMAWIHTEIERKAEEAIARLYNMYKEKN